VPIGATWHTSLVVPGDDPFDVPARIEDVGTPIVLSSDGRTAELREELFDTVQAEGKLAEAGVECRIKDAQGVSCFACPLFDADDALCQLGRRQQTILTELRVLHFGGRRQ
jgi:hypothetical protein